MRRNLPAALLATAALLLSVSRPAFAQPTSECQVQVEPGLALLSKVVGGAFAASGGDKPVPGEAVLSDKDKAEILTGKKIDVPGHVQDGSKCGLYALKMVMDYYHRKDKKHANPPADAGKAGDGGLTPLYDWAKASGRLMNDGGETTMWSLDAIAKAYGYGNTDTDRAPNPPGIRQLKKSLDAGVPPIITCNKHWMVVEGFYNKNGVEYVIVKHGHDARDFVYRWDDIEDGWDNMWHAVVYVKP